MRTGRIVAFMTMIESRNGVAQDPDAGQTLKTATISIRNLGEPGAQNTIYG